MSLAGKPSYRSISVLGMPRGNPSPKLAISVDPTVHRGVVEAAEAEGVSTASRVGGVLVTGDDSDMAVLASHVEGSFSVVPLN